MANQNQKVTLEKIAKEKLSKEILRYLEDVDIEVLEKIEPGFSLSIGKKDFTLRLIIKTSTKKFMTWLGGLVTTTGIIVSVLKWFTPILIGYFSRSLP